jgi:O-methyltransferase
VWIDCVLYESARCVLEFIRPLLQNGTVLMFNDFYRFKGHPALGERKAFGELLAANPSLLVTDYGKFASVGQAFLVHMDDMESRRPPSVGGPFGAPV